jgi:hypothetical protein
MCALNPALTRIRGCPGDCRDLVDVQCPVAVARGACQAVRFASNEFDSVALVLISPAAGASLPESAFARP